jgi:hypothetical protein
LERQGTGVAVEPGESPKAALLSPTVTWGLTLTEIKKPRDRATVTPIEEDEATDGSSREPVVQQTDVETKDEPVKDPAVRPTDLWPKDEPTKDPIVKPTDLWPKDEPTKDSE